MSKYECYYVINIKSPRIVTEITEDFLSQIVHYDNLITISCFAMYETLKDARKAQRETGGVILKGVKA